MRTREQERSRECWDVLVKSDRFDENMSLLSNPESDQPEEDECEVKRRKEAQIEAKKYLNGLNRTAASIHVAGLGQAVAFLWARHQKTPAYGKVAADISSLVLRHLGEPVREEPPKALLTLIRERDVWALMLATEESLAVISWLKRYLEGAGVEPQEPEEADGGDPNGGNAAAESD